MQSCGRGESKHIDRDIVLVAQCFSLTLLQVQVILVSVMFPLRHIAPHSVTRHLIDFQHYFTDLSLQ